MLPSFKLSKTSFIVKPLTTNDINNCLLKVSKKQYLGCFPSNKLPDTFAVPPFGLVINTHPSDMPGEHWLAIFVDKTNTLHYFDSLGFPPLEPDILDYLSKFRRQTINKIALQNPISVTCGHFAIAFLTLAFVGMPYHKIIALFQKKKGNVEAYVTGIVKKLMCI